MAPLREEEERERNRLGRVETVVEREQVRENESMQAVERKQEGKHGVCREQDRGERM